MVKLTGVNQYNLFMPRQNRIFEIGGIYHVLNRGVEKRKIFLKNQDYHRFILGLEFFNSSDQTNLWSLLAAKAGTVPALAADRKTEIPPSVGERLAAQRAKPKKCLVDLLAFALMPNHYHLIIRETQESGTSEFMRKMGGYSTYFNLQNNRVGPLFQGRYKAVPMETDPQISLIFAYVHTNPVELTDRLWKKSGTVVDKQKTLAALEEYPWSSYRDYIGLPQFPHVTKRDFFLKRFGGEKECRKAVEKWIGSEARRFPQKELKFE